MPPASDKNTMLGMPGIKPSAPITPAVMANERGELKICWAICVPTSLSLPTRDTTMAAATEMSRAGICATSASPTASKM